MSVPLDYRNHAEPAVVRQLKIDLMVLKQQHRVEKNLVCKLQDAILLLDSYAALLDAMYLESLNDGYGESPNGKLKS